MKKVICFILTGVILLSCFAVGSFAADKSDVLAKLNEAIPADFQSTYYVMFENILNQIDVDAAQADKLIALINDAKNTIPNDGRSYSEYISEYKDYAIKKINEASDILGVTATFSTEKGDTKVVITDKSGKKLGELNGTIVKKTNVPEVSVAVQALPFATIALVALAGATLSVKKKVFAE